MKIGAFVFLCLIELMSSDDKTIHFVFVISRNGARAPSNLDENNTDILGEIWDGENELTNVGKRQQYLLGYYNNLRYKNENKLLDEEYDPRDIFISSFESNRTLQSAYAQMRGLFPFGKNLTNAQIKTAVPPNKNESSYKEEKENLGLKTLPNEIMVIPVHTFYVKDHTFGLEKVSNCPNLDNSYYKKKIKSSKVKSLMNKIVSNYRDNIINIINDSKIKAESLTKDINLMIKITDAFICGYLDGRNFSKFSSNESKQLEFYYYSQEFIHALSFSSNDDSNLKEKEIQIAKISLTPIFIKLLNWTESKIQSIKENKNTVHSYITPRYVGYIVEKSSLDILSLFLSNTFNISILRQNYFSSSIAIELISNNVNTSLEDNSFSIRILYDTEEIATIPYTTYKQEISSIISSALSYKDMQKYCGWEEEEPVSFDYFILSTFALAIIFFIIEILVLNLFLNKKRKKYVPLQ